MRIIHEISPLFSLGESPLFSPKKDFVGYRLEDCADYKDDGPTDNVRVLFYMIALIANDSFDFFVNNSPATTTRAYTLGFFSPFHLFGFQKRRPPKGLCICFTESFIHQAYQSGPFNRDFPFFWNNENFYFINEENAKVLLHLGQKILEEYENKSPLSAQLIIDYVHIFLLESKRIITSGNIIDDYSVDNHLLRQFYTLVNHSNPLIRSVETAAGILYVTPARLWSVVKKLTGQSPSEIINQRILSEAKSLLTHSKLTVSEIGFHLRFKEKSHFTRFFKNLTGMSPVDYARQTRS